MSGYFNNIKLPDSSGRPVDLGIRENLAATKMITDSFRAIGDRERNEFKEAEARRLRKLQEEREQFKFDKEVNTDKALIDYQNQLARASAGGAMSQEQNNQLGEEYDRLIKEVGEDKAAIIINEKAQKFGAQDAKRAESDPYYRAELIKGVALPSGNIDPKNLIDLRNSQITRNETLGQRKDDLETRAKEREEDLWFKKQELAMRQAEKNERAREKLDAKKAVAELVGVSMNDDQNRSSSGAYYNVHQVNTGNKVLQDGTVIPEGEGSKELSEIDKISEKINSIANKNRKEDGSQINFANRDEAFKAYLEENPDAANSSIIGKGIDRTIEGTLDVAKSSAIKSTSLPIIAGAKLIDKTKQAFMSDIEKEEYNKKLNEEKAKKAEESLKSNNNDNKAKSENISFDDYWKLKKQEQSLDNAELKKLQDELGNKSVTYSSNLANKYGVDEIKSVPKEMTPHEARIYATQTTVKKLVERGVSEENALKLGIQEGENAFKFQSNYINNVNEDAKEKAKNRYTEVKEQRKALQDEIKTLESRKFDIGKNKESKIVYNGSTVKLSEVQDSLDNEISRLKKELAELK